MRLLWINSITKRCVFGWFTYISQDDTRSIQYQVKVNSCWRTWIISAHLSVSDGLFLSYRSKWTKLFERNCSSPDRSSLSKLLQSDRGIYYKKKRAPFCSLLPYTISGRRSNWCHCRFRFTNSRLQHDITARVKVRPTAVDSDKMSTAGFVTSSQVVQTFF